MTRYHLTIYSQDGTKRERWWTGTVEDLDRFLDDVCAPFVVVTPGGRR